ncbi:MAG: carbonic anhydrase [Phototrophicaceae bacterium]
MLRLRFVAITVLMVLASVAVGILAQEHGGDEPPHWTYEVGSEVGPEVWGTLSEDFALCGAGKTQSPINVVTTVPVDIADIAFDYSSSALNILNNGHTVQVNYDAGSSISYNGTPYDLLQFHFHTPSEHTINGEAVPMEIHFVHRDANGNLAVVGVMLTEGDADNAAYADVLANLPAEEADVTTLDFTVSAADMMPAEKTFYTYSGSLTTPPCSEGVRWLLLDTPVSLSAAQIAAFNAVFELNARPVQPVNARDVLNDTASN